MIIVWLVQRRLKMAKFVVLDLALLVYLVDLIVAAGCAQPGIRVAPCECGTMQEIVRWTGDRACMVHFCRYRWRHHVRNSYFAPRFVSCFPVRAEIVECKR